jgi:SAM-dependent methyltransferase
VRANPSPLKYSIHTCLREFHLRRILSDLDCRKTMLDVGCGLGYWIETFGKHFVTAIGMDCDMAGLKANRQRGLSDMVQASAFALPFADGTVDLIICSEVLEHLPADMDRTALECMARALRPGGRLIITTPSLEGLRSRSRLRNLGHTQPGTGEYHYRVGYTLQMYRDLLAHIPLLSLKSHRFSMFLFSELFMDLQKLLFYRKRELREHSDIMTAGDSILFRAYRFFFPILRAAFIFEDIVMCPLFKGHIHILELERISDTKATPCLHS